MVLAEMKLLCVALILVVVGAQPRQRPYPRDKPGFCPPREGGGIICRELCTSDYSCPGNQKCCCNGHHGCCSCQKPTTG